jgi:hypothetical protein
MKVLKNFIPFAAVLCLGGVALGEDTPMEKEMGVMNTAYKALKKSINDPAQKAENLKLIADIKKTTESTAKMEPKMAADQGAKKAEFLAKYKAEMAEFGKAVDALEAAVKGGDTAAAAAAFAKLGELKKKGHEEFKKD